MKLVGREEGDERIKRNKMRKLNLERDFKQKDKKIENIEKRRRRWRREV